MREPDFSVLPREQSMETKRKKYHLKTKKPSLFNCESSQTLKQVAQKPCAFPSYADTQNLTGCGPGHPAAAGTAWAAGLD